MGRPSKPQYRSPLEPNRQTPIERKLIGDSIVFNWGADELQALALALAPPSAVYPMEWIPATETENPNAYRDWMIRVLSTLVDCYPHPLNLALDSLRLSLIEVNRGLTPNLFKPAKRASRKGNYAAQSAANLAVLAANFIHDHVRNDAAFVQELEDAGTSRLEIDGWKNGRIDPAFRCDAILAFQDFKAAKSVLADAVADYRAASARKSK